MLYSKAISKISYSIRNYKYIYFKYTLEKLIVSVNENYFNTYNVVSTNSPFNVEITYYIIFEFIKYLSISSFYEYNTVKGCNISFYKKSQSFLLTPLSIIFKHLIL